MALWLGHSTFGRVSKPLKHMAMINVMTEVQGPRRVEPAGKASPRQRTTPPSLDFWYTTSKASRAVDPMDAYLETPTQCCPRYHLRMSCPRCLSQRALA